MKPTSQFAVKNAQILSCAAHGYDFCTTHFGAPRDPKREYEIRIGERGTCSYDLLRRRYVITIKTTDETPFAVYLQIGHEMCHRFAYRLYGLVALGWVEELIACQTSTQFCANYGFERELGSLNTFYRKLQKPSGDEGVKLIGTTRIVPKFHCAGYSDAFYAAATCTGNALVYLVGWRSVVRLCFSRNWNEWYAGLPTHCRSLVRIVLETSYGSELSASQLVALRSEKPESLFRLGWAFYEKGDYANAILLLQLAIDEDPDNRSGHAWLGRVYFEKEDYDAAAPAWALTAARQPANGEAHYCLGLCYLCQEDLDGAISELTAAVRLRPTNALYWFELGQTYSRSGDGRMARECWRRTVQFGDAAIIAKAEHGMSQL